MPTNHDKPPQPPASRRQKLSLDLGIISLVPTAIWYLVFLAIPLAILALYSFWRIRDFQVVPEWNLDNYRMLVAEPIYLPNMVKSFRISLVVTLVSVCLGYLVAYVIAMKMTRFKMEMLFLVVAPFWTSYVLRAYAWMAILGDRGVINSSLMMLGVIREPLRFLLYSQFALVIGFVHIFFPFAVLAIFASLDRIDRSLLAAARDLGARPGRAFVEVTLPLSMPGVVAAALFVFLPVLGEYVTPRLLGGPTGTMTSNLLVSQFGASMQWGLGAAIGFVLMAVMFVLVTVLTRKYSLDKLY